jgi:hypothetical protein
MINLHEIRIKRIKQNPTLNGVNTGFDYFKTLYEKVKTLKVRLKSINDVDYYYSRTLTSSGGLLYKFVDGRPKSFAKTSEEDNQVQTFMRKLYSELLRNKY